MFTLILFVYDNLVRQLQWQQNSVRKNTHSKYYLDDIVRFKLGAYVQHCTVGFFSDVFFGSKLEQHTIEYLES